MQVLREQKLETLVFIFYFFAVEGEAASGGQVAIRAQTKLTPTESGVSEYAEDGWCVLAAGACGGG